MEKTKKTFVKYTDDYDLLECFDDLVSISLLLGSILMIPTSGGLTVLTSIGIAQGIFHLKDQVINIRDYVNDNGDGTYTINEEFIQAVLKAAQNLEEQGFNNYLSCFDTQKGCFVYRGISSFYENSVPNSPFVSVTYSYEGSERLACVNGWFCEIDHDLKTISIPYRLYKNGNYVSSSTRYAVYYWFNDPSASNFFLSMSMPMFNTYDEAVAAYESNNFSGALNYREKPWFSKGSSYTPIYTGGSVRVSQNVIVNINQKIADVESDESLTTDEKIVILQEYIRSGVIDETDGGGGEDGSDDNDYDDNKDLPSGTDLSDANAWLKKIYLKDCQIYDKISDFSGQFMQEYIRTGITDETDGGGGEDGSGDNDYDDNKDLSSGTDLSDANAWLKKIYLKDCQIYDKISGSSGPSMSDVVISIGDLSEMLKNYLSTIAFDLNDIKGQLENMSEQEFNGKSD